MINLVPVERLLLQINNTLERIADALERTASTEANLYTVTSVPVSTIEAIKNMPDDKPWEEPAASPPPSRADVIAALNLAAKVHGTEAGKKIIKSFGAVKLDDVPEDKWAEVIKACKAGT